MKYSQYLIVKIITALEKLIKSSNKLYYFIYNQKPEHKLGLCKYI